MHHEPPWKQEEIGKSSEHLSLSLSLSPPDCEPQPARQQQRAGKCKGSQLAAQRVAHVVGYQ